MRLCSRWRIMPVLDHSICFLGLWGSSASGSSFPALPLYLQPHLRAFGSSCIGAASARWQTHQARYP